MITRRGFLQSTGAVAALAAGVRGASADTPGITDAEIKIGQTMPYSGPASAYGVIGRTEAAFFKMINDQGGVNGRKINLISLDDAYSPPKTVEQVRRLVEEEKVAFLFNTLGTAPNLAIRQYLNDNKVPQLFVSTGAGVFSDPEHFPWTIGYNPNYRTESRIYGKHILATKPDGKVALLYQNDGFGKEYLAGLKEGLGDKAEAMIVKDASYETSEPTINSQVVTLQGSGADILVIAATPKFAAQAIRKSYDLGWNGVRYLSERLAFDRDGAEAGRAREVEGTDHRLLRQGSDRRQMGGRRRHEGMGGVLRQIHVEGRVRRRQRGLRIQRRRHDAADAEAVRRRPHAR